MPSRITPGVYATVFGRQPGEPPGSPRAMPAQSRVATRGAADVPTSSDWAEPPSPRHALPQLISPRARSTEEEFSMKLLESQIRSEKRMAEAALATALAVKAQEHAQQKRREAMIGSGSLSARF